MEAPRVDRQWQTRVLGPLADAYWQETEAIEEHEDTRNQPAILFADQAKAFERIQWPWLMRVVQRWGAPTWVLHAVRTLVCQRQVQTIIA
eukprot:10232785-Prorocentrum_lima.AAC.1